MPNTYRFCSIDNYSKIGVSVCQKMPRQTKQILKKIVSLFTFFTEVVFHSKHSKLFIPNMALKNLIEKHLKYYSSSFSK